MRQFNILFRWGWTFLVVVTLGLAGCDGDDGAAGAAGVAGGAGPTGPAGPAGPPGPGASVTPLESCGVCHDTDSIADAGAAHALPPIEAVSAVAFAVDGLDLDVTFTLEADGVLATNYDSMQRGYRSDGTTRTDICGAASRDDPCDPALLTLTNNGSGNYTITIVGGATEALNDNRYLFRVGAGDDRETRVYFYGDTGTPPVGPAAVSAEACTACHGPEGIDVHGGYYAAVDGAEPCLTCHGVDAVPSLGAAAHLYHSGLWEEEVPRGSGNFEFVEVTYPTYMNNCSVCHNEAAQLTAVNAMPFSGAGCFSCHGSMAGFDFTGPPDYTDLHLGIPDPETADCTVCHDPAGFAPAKVVVTDSHNGATTGRGGVIWNGEDTSVTEGALIDWQITGVADDGTDLTITWQASYNGVGVDPCNATPAAGAPAFFAIPPFLFAGDTEPDDRNNLSILLNYAQGEDFILGTRVDRAGQPDGDVDVDDTNTTCVGNVATTVVPVEVDDTYAMYGRVAIQGKPWVVAVDPDDEDGVMQVRAFTPTYDWVIGDDAAAPARRAVADSGLCLNCHVGSLYQHGGNRVDNVDMCYLCHNAAANDEYVRVDEFGVDASEAYDGRAGQAFGIKEMVHAVHPAGATGNPWVVYRGRGIYAFADDVSKLSNWPGSGEQEVFGSDDGMGNPVLENHTFESPTYPRGLYDCAACHVAGVDILPDPTIAMATTVEAGAPPFGDQLNDVLEGVQTSSCITCHADSASKGHAYQNSWVPQEFPEGRQTIIDAN